MILVRFEGGIFNVLDQSRPWSVINDRRYVNIIEIRSCLLVLLLNGPETIA